MQTPADIVTSDEYQLDRRATALKKAGDWNGAIAALRQRKALLGVQWEDDKLAMYLQQAGRFDEAMAEIQWLLDHSQARVRELFGHQPVSAQQASHARFAGRVHRAAALICKREGRADLAATHITVADRYMAIAQRLDPIGREESKRHRENALAATKAAMSAKNARHEVNMNRFDLQKLIAERALGRPIETTRPVHMSINQTIEAVWPLNERFRPHLVQIQSLAYDKRLEGAADTAIERWMLDGANWDKEPPGVWRVLLERQYQVLQLLGLRAAEAKSWDAPFIPVPEPADGALRAKLAIVFLLHSTPLPFPVTERAGAELPQGNFAGTLARH